MKTMKGFIQVELVNKDLNNSTIIWLNAFRIFQIRYSELTKTTTVWLDHAGAYELKENEEEIMLLIEEALQ